VNSNGDQQHPFTPTIELRNTFYQHGIRSSSNIQPWAVIISYQMTETKPTLTHSDTFPQQIAIY